MLAAVAIVALHIGPASAEPTASLQVEGETFVLTMPDGKKMTSADLVGASFDMTDQDGNPATVRIDSVTPSEEQPHLLLHALSVQDPTTKAWSPMCDADAKGRRAGFPVAGAWDGKGHFLKDKSRWFITCTSGSQGKCILFGYDPWGAGPHGEELAPYYQACQHMVRGDYDGSGEAHTKNGTLIDMWDDLGIEKVDASDPPEMQFEAGWGLEGAVCVAHTRWPDILTKDALGKADPALAGACDEGTARSKGALIFNRSSVKNGVE